MVGRAHRLSGENTVADAHDRRLADSRLRRGDGLAVLASPRIGVVNQFLQDMFGFADAPLSITTITGMGWVQGSI